MSTTSGVLQMAKPAPPPERFSSEAQGQPSASPSANAPDTALATDGHGDHPAYYLLLPLSVPFDIATFPIQALLYYGLFQGMH